jgi:hypothetical protein
MKQVTVGLATACTYTDTLFSTVLNPGRSRWASNRLRESIRYEN